ncbi:inactive protein RESTRICTED TEV MOVEMENT 2-like [Citrus sinensis]|nr:inactive protein RESTRICTED TEV MOVEMENT 2-like [Citrus sinensis]
METKLQLPADFEPRCRWRREEHQFVLEVHLKGFKKDQIRVFVNDQGKLRISGKRPIDEKNVESFSKRIEVPKDCKRDRIKAKLSNGILRLTMPKKTHSHATRNQAAATAGRKTLKLGVGAVAVVLVVAAAAVEAYVAYKYRQCFFNIGETWQSSRI